MEFAAAGHQVLLFTCHEHMWRMFHELEADCRRLPTRAGEEEPVVLPSPEPEPIVAAEEVAEVVAPRQLPPSKPKKIKRKKKRTSPPESRELPPEPPRREPPAPELVVQEPVVIEATVPASEFTYDWAYELTAHGKADRTATSPEEERLLAYVLTEEEPDWPVREPTRPRRA